VFRDPERGWVAGVCAGIADYVGADPLVVRLAALLCLVFFLPATLVTYAALALVLKPRPSLLYATPEEESFWRSLRIDPAQVLHEVRGRLRGVERRVVRIETLVTTDEFELRRGLRDLGG
jgi:phage shock protein C